MTNIKKFKEKSIPLEDLLLDPNNPRFSIKKIEETPEDIFGDNDVQTAIYEKMIDKRSNFEIEELAKSIKTKGFYPIDKIFVRKVKNKYLVIEGNRRITAIKYLVEKEQKGAKKDNLEKDIINSFQKISCVDLTGEDEDGINLILGLRHHGSIKEWRLLPSSFNLFTRYLKEYCNVNNCNGNNYKEFIYDPKIAEKIADLFSIKKNEVREKLFTYSVYLQILEENVEVEDDKISIINEAIKKPVIREHFGFDGRKGLFSDEGVEKFIDVCIGTDEKEPVIKEASAGESNMRDYGFVIQRGDIFISMIEEERRSASEVKGIIKDKEYPRDVINTLKKIWEEIGKVQIKDIKESLSDEENKLIDKIEERMSRLKRASGN